MLMLTCLLVSTSCSLSVSTARTSTVDVPIAVAEEGVESGQSSSLLSSLSFPLFSSFIERSG
jgi:hypothetical protein